MNLFLIISGLLASILCAGCQSNSSKSLEDECTAYEWQADHAIKDGKFKKAEQLYQLALDKAKAGDNALQFPVVLQEEAELYRLQDKLTDAENCLRSSLAAYAAINEKAAPDSKQLLTIKKVKQGTVNTLEKLADILVGENHLEEAAKFYKEAITTNKNAGGPVDDTVRIARSYTKVLRKLHRNAEADEIEDEADSANFVTVEIGPRVWEEIALFDRGDAQYSQLLHKFKTMALAAKKFRKMQLFCLAKRYQGLAEFALSQNKQAENTFREDVQGTKSLVSAGAYKQERAAELANLASFLSTENKKSEATAVFEEAMNLDAAVTRGNIVHFIDVCCQSGQLNGGKLLCEEFEKLVAEQAGKDKNEKYDDVIHAYIGLCDRYRNKRDYGNYESMVKRVSQLYLQNGKPAGKLWTTLLVRQGEANYYAGKIETAEQQLKKVIALSAGEPPDASVANSFHYLGEFCLAQHQDKKAFEYYTLACAMFESFPAFSSTYIHDSLVLIPMQLAAGKVTEANFMCEHVLKLAEANNPPQIPGILNMWGLCCRHRHDYAMAEKLQSRALQLVQKTFGPSSEPTASTLIQLGDLYSLQGKYSQATQCFEKALAIYHDNLQGKFPYLEATLQDELRAAKNKEPWPGLERPGITMKNSP